MRFEFSTSRRIIFGSGTISAVPDLAVSLGQRVLLVSDSRERCENLLGCLLNRGLQVDLFIVGNEPDIDCIILATRILRESDCQLVIGFGGGSALDTGKAAAALATNPGDPTAYLEVIGTGKTLGNPSITFIAIPTTAGTGSEVTRNAVIAVPEKRIKVSLRGPSLLPPFAVVDPELTHSLPPSITAYTGMDALTQLIEPFVCNSPSPMTDALCRDGIFRIARSLHKAYINGQDKDAREDMALASLFGGISLANARLGAVHGMANPIGGMSHAPHGAICARLLPFVMETNLNVILSRQPESPMIGRYTEVACLLSGNNHASAEMGLAWLREISALMDIRPLADYGLKKEDFAMVVEQSQKASSMKGNPVKLEFTDLLAILNKAF